VNGDRGSGPRDLLRRGGIVGDGAMGTRLMAAGLPPGEPPERWNRERPEAVAAVHRAYRAAGAVVLQTNTFGATRSRLAPFGLAREMEAINRAAVELAREAAGEGALVAGTVGPTGLRPVSGEEWERLREEFAEQVAALLAAGVDLLLVETICDPREGATAASTARSLTDRPVLVTFTFDRRGRTPSGASPEETAAAVLNAGADGAGANCGEGPQSLLLPLTRMRAAFPGVPLVAQPSAGLPTPGPAGPRYPLGPQEWAAEARRLAGLAAWLGGCCGTTPEYLETLACR
jgi:5-methyltetrahydrofolate--homocysteine methyltransferase